MDLNEIKIEKLTKMANHILTGSLEPTILENNIHPMFKSFLVIIFTLWNVVV